MDIHPHKPRSLRPRTPGTREPGPSPTRRGPSPIQDVLRSLLRESGLNSPGRGDGDCPEFRAWREALGTRAQRAAPVRFRAGELTVEVSSSGHMQEFKGFTGERLRRRVNEILGSKRICSVVFKLKG